MSIAETNAYQRILLSIKWNRYEIAKKEIKNKWEQVYRILFKVSFFEVCNLYFFLKLEQVEQHNLLEIALIEDRPNIVELMLDREINLIEFLTLERLESLHNHEAVCSLIIFRMVPNH